MKDPETILLRPEVHPEQVADEPLDFVNPYHNLAAKQRLKALASLPADQAFDIIYDNTKALMKKRLAETPIVADSYLNSPKKLERYLDAVSKKTVESSMKLLAEMRK